MVLLKAPWVGITLDPAAARQADNQLSGRIQFIECGSRQCEVDDPWRTVKPVRHLPQAQANGLAEKNGGDRLLQWILVIDI